MVDLSFRSYITDGVSDKKGFEIIKLLGKSNPEIPCIVFSTYESAGFVQRAMSREIGAKGYVIKSASERILLETIETVGNGGTFIQQELIPSMLEIKDLYNAFTKKEWTVIDYVSLGYSNEKIAEFMEITVRTVENYISHIYDKTGTNGKIEMLEKLGLR